MSLVALRQRLAEIIAPPRPSEGGIPTGISPLDAALSEGGLPCGRLTELVGARGSGKTTLARELVAGALETKRWVAFIDAERTLAPEDWAPLAASGRLWVVRPPAGGADRATWCADVLLRSGAFGLVVLDGAPCIPRGIAVRLTRLARESHAAFVVMRDDDAPGGGALVGGAVRIRVTRQANAQGKTRRDDERWRSFGARLARAAEKTPSHGASVGEGAQAAFGSASAAHGVPASSRTPIVLTLSIEKGGAHHSVEVGCAIDVARRLCANPEVPDRRGVAPRNRRGERAAPDAPGVRRWAGGWADSRTVGQSDSRPTDAADRGTGGASGAGGATLSRKRRCAEPAVGRDAFLLGTRGGGNGEWGMGDGESRREREGQRDDTRRAGGHA